MYVCVLFICFVGLQYLDKIGTNFFGVAQSATAKPGNVLGINVCTFVVCCDGCVVCMHACLWLLARVHMTGLCVRVCV